MSVPESEYKQGGYVTPVGATETCWGKAGQEGRGGALGPGWQLIRGLIRAVVHGQSESLLQCRRTSSSTHCWNA